MILIHFMHCPRHKIHCVARYNKKQTIVVTPREIGVFISPVWMNGHKKIKAKLAVNNSPGQRSAAESLCEVRKLQLQ